PAAPPEVGGQAAGGLRRRRQGQHAAELLPDRPRDPRVRGGPESLQAGALPAGGAPADLRAGAASGGDAGLRAAALLEPGRRGDGAAGGVPATGWAVHRAGPHATHRMSEIEGVRVVPLARIPDERGTVLHMLKASDPHFLRFGEIYFSMVYPGIVKGWHRHQE